MTVEMVKKSLQITQQLLGGTCDNSQIRIADPIFLELEAPNTGSLHTSWFCRFLRGRLRGSAAAWRNFPASRRSCQAFTWGDTRGVTLRTSDPLVFSEIMVGATGFEGRFLVLQVAFGYQQSLEGRYGRINVVAGQIGSHS